MILTKQLKNMMKQINKKKIWIMAAIVILMVFFDQLSKHLITARKDSLPLIVIDNFFTLDYVKNTGASFGMMQGNNSLLIWLSFIILGLLFYFHDHLPKKSSVFFPFIVAGTIGNLIDRIRNGFVVDFLDVYFRSYHWPTFNLADSSIVVGVVGLIILFILEEKEQKDNRND